ncbi:hypothetical protein A3G67_03815 [Candidatus Roizmanbacteria bacterium RIFCSPLOWO2_12_FULL_40_12]|uniref:DNA-directed DNA polymerase n=1 Tax=Candidatus Roizmanbacteria bacterium RIFCSPLOWO2_01_FULL_40_42 TaxID=1802066 RepID=A0A1F7J5S9_9BACT|nr:MAG: hypothetical protein A2779_03450 [Candidatus Roizmanbacteria bacterium RIFCSPHIGHO2_01_FULL_40_98]OGK28391.1 MAG: hypothetical protein A3C31_00815 [Candidatus Roizmanbacteria bacterium RIFCSPHIGHO2_02_FULL_40_53]OGK30627.1 MAG: hypothetical protein A2W49_03500 [Candidatus Roizmanbacteria bacterium RIFCSPHIGHO2_12_41_18]OGK35955.1 MAG: hypothetical protein A3E69_03185 [Candidatus Roizmanbacteria bacterium RIFCSPHIGHO2_12_FULL_40_130]OGK50947.1 MAG: hypothetical protein A3B50_01585 [Candi
MLTIVCGEDTVASRAYFQEVIETYKKKDYEVLKISPDQLPDVQQEHFESLSLFGLKKVYFIENLNKTLKRGGSDKLLKTLETLGDTPLIIWEDGVSKRELKLQKAGSVKEFKPGENVFKLLDSCYPKNLRSFLLMLDELATPQNEMFLFIMLQRHMRNLVLVATGNPPSSLQSWQVGKLKGQSSHWETNSLLDFYDKLINLEIGLKSGKGSYTLKKGIEMLACYYLG